MNSTFHTPVLSKEVLQHQNVKKSEWYIDTTLGGGGHTFKILEEGGNVLGIDIDKDAIEYVWEKVKSQKSKVKSLERLTLVQGNFREIDKIAHSKGITRVAGILYDLGVSSHQLDTKELGFSFMQEGPLDMRMDKDLSVKARDLINGLTKKELYLLFTRYGEEKNAWKIASRIIKTRDKKPIETTKELADIIHKAIGRQTGDIHPATRVFQALRIAVNDELNSLKESLPKAINLLKPKGRLLIISFHSLEDRIVKEIFREFEDKSKGKVLTKKPIIPSTAEVMQNRRSRSAKLRVFEKQ